jgi:hypothetical protein
MKIFDVLRAKRVQKARFFIFLGKRSEAFSLLVASNKKTDFCNEESLREQPEALFRQPLRQREKSNMSPTQV